MTSGVLLLTVFSSNSVSTFFFPLADIFGYTYAVISEELNFIKRCTSEVRICEKAALIGVGSRHCHFGFQLPVEDAMD